MTISDERSKPSATVRRTGSVQKCEVNDSSVRRIVFFNAEAARGRIFGGVSKARQGGDRRGLGLLESGVAWLRFEPGGICHGVRGYWPRQKAPAASVGTVEKTKGLLFVEGMQRPAVPVAEDEARGRPATDDEGREAGSSSEGGPMGVSSCCPLLFGNTSLRCSCSGRQE